MKIKFTFLGNNYIPTMVAYANELFRHRSGDPMGNVFITRNESGAKDFTKCEADLILSFYSDGADTSFLVEPEH